MGKLTKNSQVNVIITYMEQTLKKLQLIILFLFINLSLEAKYCIQVLTSNVSERNAIVGEARSGNYTQFEDVRVETRGRYLVFRIGDYKKYSDARDDIREVKRVQKSAYVRKCDFNQDKAIYVQNMSQRDEFYEQPKEVYTPPKKTYVKRAPKKVKAPVVHKKKKRELTYTYQANDKSLWGDCKKCFIPVYEEEDDSTYVEVQPKQRVAEVEYVEKRNKKIEVKVPKKRVTKASFWEEEKPRKKVKNRYDIDEEFLP